MKLLIVYGTTEGHTRKICEFLRDEASKAGHDVALNDTTRALLQPGEFDAVIVAASVHYGNHQTSVEHYVEEYHEKLNDIPGVFLSVSLAAATDEPESLKELDQITRDFLKKTCWTPTYIEQVAGALLYTKYNFFKRFLMRMIAQKSGGGTDTSEDYEYTDWDKVRDIIAKLDKAVKREQQSALQTGTKQ